MVSVAHCPTYLSGLASVAGILQNPSLEPGSPRPLYRIRNKSLEDFDHVLDMVGHGLQSFDHTFQDHTSIEQC